MAGDDVRQAFEALLPQEEIERPYVQFGAIKRQRKLNLDMSVQAWGISAGTPNALYQANVPRSPQVDAEPPFTVITLLHASLVPSVIAALLAHAYHVKARPQRTGAPWTKAPLLRRRPALQFSVSCRFIAQSFGLKRAEAERCWEKTAELLTYAGRDANWRRRPSVLDQLRGWKRQPAVRKNAGDHNVQAAA